MRNFINLIEGNQPKKDNFLKLLEKQLVNESGPSRILKHIQNGVPFFMISAMRADLDYPSNLKRTKNLQNDITNSNLAFIRTEGEFHEEGQEKPSKELSFFVMMRGEAVDMIHVAKKLMKKYNQDAILAGDGEDVFLLFNDGSRENVGNINTFDPSIISNLDGYSKIKGRAFSFVTKDKYEKLKKEITNKTDQRFGAASYGEKKT